MGKWLTVLARDILAAAAPVILARLLGAMQRPDGEQLDLPLDAAPPLGKRFES